MKDPEVKRISRLVDVSRGRRPTPRARLREAAGPCRLGELEAILDHRAWFIARVMGGEEFRVVDRLDQRGIFAFTPTRADWRRRNRYQREKSLRLFAVAPGYVVFAQPLDFRLQRWVSVLNCEGVIDVYGMETAGAPLEIGVANAEAVAGLCTQAKEYARWMRSGAEFVEGDEVRVAAGPFEGLTSRVLEIRRDRARIMAEIFAHAREVTVRLGDLERVG